ncbi:MAG: hypothetical protein IPH94_09945 [Saprospiraceae bacterium]|nr:hypothetical protein [Saprospiraceae bacterium]MBK7788297.1 hypothetical protein [Saprospiraceae bacterium]MBK8111076.1 hypothetical protein [Saprospiraceae bacterium]MBK8851512.1 hypothetical protein [Saprospiraceae bacterium]MBK9688300.1 hypothetical protein [Saprospiraceae bacterium]
MSKSRYKITGFARFMLFMLFFVPIGYTAYHLYEGNSPKDGLRDLKTSLQNFKKKLKGEQVQEEDTFRLQLQQKDEEIQKLREALFQCEQGKS